MERTFPIAPNIAWVCHKCQPGSNSAPTLARQLLRSVTFVAASRDHHLCESWRTAQVIADLISFFLFPSRPLSYEPGRLVAPLAPAQANTKGSEFKGVGSDFGWANRLQSPLNFLGKSTPPL